MKTLNGVKLDVKDKLLAVVLGVGIVAAPLLAGLFAGGAFGYPDSDTGAVLLVSAAMIVAASIAFAMPPEGRKLIWDTYLLFRAVGFCLGAGLLGGLIMMSLVKIGVEKILAGAIGYGVFAVFTSLLIGSAFAFFLFWLHIMDKKGFEKLKEDQSEAG